jgi:predicted transcriptional regulator
MDTLLIKIPTDKREFFLSLLRELAFVQVEETFTEEQEQVYLAAVLESEADIAEGRLITQEDLEKEVKSWQRSDTQ